MSAPIIEAIEQGDSARVREILATDPEAATARDERGVSVLMLAMYHRAQEALDLLLATEPTLDLFEAAALGRRERLRELLADEAPVGLDLRSGDGFTALHYACFFARPDVVDLLLDAGADPNAVATNPSQVQPLHSAAAARSREIVESLLRQGASVNARQHGGHTALHAAAMHGDESMVRLLLEYGADPHQIDEAGISAIDRARESGHTRIVTLFEGR